MVVSGGKKDEAASLTGSRLRDLWHKSCRRSCRRGSGGRGHFFSESRISRSSSTSSAGAAGAASSGLLMRSEEHTSELQSLMRISYAVFCLKKKKIDNKRTT